MAKKRFPFKVLLVITCLLAVTACAPAAQGEGALTSGEGGAMATSSDAQDEGVLTLSEDGAIVASSDTQDTSSQPGSSDPGAAERASKTQTKTEGAQPPSESWLFYKDLTYKFGVYYPPDYVFSAKPAEELAKLDPRPSASFSIMNPKTASSDVVELEPADLEIRLFDPAGVTSLDNWLTSVGMIASTDSPQPFKTANVSGVSVCASTMIAPGCSYFVMGKGWVYQLTPATLEGESMIETFVLIP